MLRISIGLASILLSVLSGAHALGLLPDRIEAVTAGRKNLCESIALYSSAAVQREDTASLAQILPALVKRNPDIASAGLRSAQGDLVVRVGDHDAPWQAEAEEHSTPTHMQVPIALNERRWGTLEMRFQPMATAGWIALPGGPVLPFVAFVVSLSVVGYFFYLRRVLRHIDPKQTKLMPERVRATLDTVAEGVLVLDKKQRIALANTAFAKIIGRAAEDLQGQSASDLPWRKKHEPDELPWVRAIQEGKLQTGTILGLTTDGQGKRTLAVNSTPIVADDGACRGALATFDDLSPVETANAKLRKAMGRLRRSRNEVHRQNRELALAKKAADAANQAKSDFLANVSHEIRTPMNAILGMTEFMLADQVEPEQEEGLQIVQASAHSLLAVINDILDFSKIEAGKFELDPIDFDLGDTLDGTVKMLTLRAQQKGLHLRGAIASGVPSAIVGDAGRLRQVLVNLIGNAIKFTSHGEVVVRVGLESHTAEGVMLHFTVADTGIGIPADKLGAVFEPFVQADGSTTRKYGGTGLGLTICRRLVELMGGRIWAESEPGLGSTFHFTGQFQVANTLAGESDPAGTADGSACQLNLELPRLRVLLVDDNAFNQRVGLLKLQQKGQSVVTIGSGRDALRLLEHERFDLIFMDVQMPDMSGLEVTEAIRRREKETGGHIPIVAMTACAMKGDRENCLTAGMDGYVIKPIDDNALAKLLKEFAPRNAQASPSVPTVSPAAEMAPSIPQARPETAPLDLESAIDIAASLRQIGGNTELWDELVVLFRSECEPLMTTIRGAIDHGNSQELEKAAHNLKGMVKFLSANAAVEEATRLEELGKKGQSADAEMFARLDTQIRRVNAALNAATLLRTS